MVTLQVLDLEVVLVLQLGDLHVLHMLNISHLFFQLLHFVEQFPVLKIGGSRFVDGQALKLILPHLHLILLLVNQLRQPLVLPQQLIIMLHYQLRLVLQLIHLTTLRLQYVYLLDQTVVFTLKGTDQELHRFGGCT